jgi:hypothetical protein
MRFIVSTVGTSILTNSINRTDPDEARDWAKILVESANLKKDELLDKPKTVIIVKPVIICTYGRERRGWVTQPLQRCYVRSHRGV